MFTGIVEATSKIKKIDKNNNQSSFLIENIPFDLKLGESLSVNGVCLTVAEKDHSSYLFYISPETLNCTQLSDLDENDSVNLERALQVNDRLSGHFVQGHVDCTGNVTSIESLDDSILLKVRFPSHWSKYCIPKGSITLNGVSLTINQIEESQSETIISLCLIPHTFKSTTFCNLHQEDRINIEFDCLAKHLEKLWNVSKKQ